MGRSVVVGLTMLAASVGMEITENSGFKAPSFDKLRNTFQDGFDY
jgi:hypothetical protein